MARGLDGTANHSHGPARTEPADVSSQRAHCSSRLLSSPPLPRSPPSYVCVHLQSRCDLGSPRGWHCPPTPGDWAAQHTDGPVWSELWASTPHAPLGPPALVSPALDEGLELTTPQAAPAPIFHDPVTWPLGGPASTGPRSCPAAPLASLLLTCPDVGGFNFPVMMLSQQGGAVPS